MSRMRNDRKSGWKRFFTGKGFYVALAVCLVAVCGVAVATFVDTLPKTQGGKQRHIGHEQPLVTSPTTEQPVDNPVSDVPYERPTTTTPTTAATKPPTTPVDTKPADLFMLPIGNEVLKPFSDGQPVYSETMQDWRTHNGTDFKGEKGTEVKAVADGTILKVENDPLWGPVIEIDHGFQIISRYCGVTAKRADAGSEGQGRRCDWQPGRNPRGNRRGAASPSRDPDGGEICGSGRGHRPGNEIKKHNVPSETA